MPSPLLTKTAHPPEPAVPEVACAYERLAFQAVLLAAALADLTPARENRLVSWASRMSAAEWAAAVRSDKSHEFALAVSSAHKPLDFHQLSRMLQCCWQMSSGVDESGK